MPASGANQQSTCPSKGESNKCDEKGHKVVSFSKKKNNASHNNSNNNNNGGNGNKEMTNADVEFVLCTLDSVLDGYNPSVKTEGEIMKRREEKDIDMGSVMPQSTIPNLKAIWNNPKCEEFALVDLMQEPRILHSGLHVHTSPRVGAS